MRSIQLVASFLFGLLVVVPGGARAEGTYYGMFYDSVLESYFLGTVDPPTGAVTLKGSGIPAKWLTFGGNHMAADATLGVAYVNAGPNVGSSSNRTLYTVDLATGNMLDSSPLQDAMSPVADLRLSPFLFDYDPTTGTIYAIVQTDITPVENRTWWVATIDSETGEIDPIGAGFSLQFSGGDSALDPVNGLFHFIGPPASGQATKVYSVSITTGAVVSNPDVGDGGVGTLSTAPDVLDYDTESGKVFGVFNSNHTTPRTRYLMEVNTATGALTPKGDTFTSTTPAIGRGAIDPTAGIYYAMFRESSQVPFDLFALDLDAVTGTVLASPELDHDDEDKREYPDFVAFVPEPGALAGGLAALLTCAALRRSRAVAVKPQATR